MVMEIVYSFLCDAVVQISGDITSLANSITISRNTSSIKGEFVEPMLRTKILLYALEHCSFLLAFGV